MRENGNFLLILGSLGVGGSSVGECISIVDGSNSSVDMAS